jgi:trehalose synthase-fused probable maltokinase
MTGMSPEALPTFLKAQRWFGGKGRSIESATVIDEARWELGAERATFILAVVEVRYAAKVTERYWVTVRLGDDGALTEAMEHDAFAHALLQLLRSGGKIDAGAGALLGETLESGRSVLAGLSSTPPVRRLGVEQTNTSLVFADQVILKVIRKLEPGPNPEWELGKYLAGRPRFRTAPPLLGGIVWQGPFAATAVVAHQFIRARGDGWKTTLELFREAPRLSPAALLDFGQLGAELGALHLALGAEPKDPAFAPEPIGQADLDRWSASIIGELGVTLAQAQSTLPELAAAHDALLARARALTRLSPSGMKIRIHGDLHLGQVLRTDEGFRIFDFEGEPSRPIEQRRVKHSPLKDVAGMLRSFEYAGATVELEGKPPGPRAASARSAFLAGYQQAMRGSVLVPQDDAGFTGLLDALVLEKALYELRYELSHRPDWVRIPAKALLATER